MTKEIKLTIFQYKIIHYFLYTNSILYKMKKVENPLCPFCTNVDQTISHLFVSCPCASSFWSEFTKWYQSISKKTLNLSKNEVMYGVLNDWSSCSTLNHLILIGKYFLYCKALNSGKFQFADYIKVAVMMILVFIGRRASPRFRGIGRWRHSSSIWTWGRMVRIWMVIF